MLNKQSIRFIRRGVHSTPSIIAIADRPIATIIDAMGSQQSALNLELLWVRGVKIMQLKL
jgi:hypothetical protein